MSLQKSTKSRLVDEMSDDTKDQEIETEEELRLLNDPYRRDSTFELDNIRTPTPESLRQ